MFCNKCGAQISDAATFCNNCGANLKTRKQENWFNRHLNWTWFLGLVSCFVIAIAMGIVSGLNPFYDEGILEAIVDIYYFVVIITVSVYVIMRKNRSLAWIFLVGWFSPLWLRNKRKTDIDPQTAP